MKLLLDTHVLLWFFIFPEKLSLKARSAVEDSRNELFFSPVSLFEISVKRMKDNPEFQVDVDWLHREIVTHGFTELPLLTAHSLRVLQLPSVHKDPFDRLLLAQALVENLLLLTADSLLLQYPINTLDAR